ncbi:heavy metal translocating P-type ATPase [bacterium]|jgi:heavy metal translocating P-type ATPase|nr:heavy metal translocating P-type ATPase [bacterium]
MTNVCIHCRTPVQPTSKLEKELFCCLGCRTVYTIINKSNLGQYYDLKESSTFFKPAAPIKTSSNAFEYLDQEISITKFSANTPNTMSFYLEGIHCIACLWLIEQLGTLVEGVVSSRLNIGSSHVIITKTPDGSFSEIAKTLNKLGYTPHPIDQTGETTIQKKDHRKSLIRLGIAAACTSNIMIFSLALYFGVDGTLETVFRWGSALLLVPIISYTNIPFYKGVKSAFFTKKIGIDVPVVISIGLGSILSYINLITNSPHIYFDSISTFSFLLLSTRHFFKYATQKLDHDRLLQASLIPVEATQITTKNTLVKVLSDALQKNDLITIQSNEVIAADGVLHNCDARIDAHVITGESLPIKFKSGTQVFAGMKNIGDQIQIKVTHAGKNSRIGTLIHQITHQEKPHLVQLADTVSKWFLVITLIIGATLLGWDWVHLHTLAEGFNRSLALIILACPCALSLATPLSYALSVKKAAENGICLKNPNILETLRQIDTIIFDKTGTLTSGQLTVLDWNILNNSPPMYDVAYSLEKDARHPIGKAIIRHLKTTFQAEGLPMTNLQETPGVGVKGNLNGDAFEIKSYICNSKQTQKSPITSVGLFKNDQCLVQITLGDSILNSSYPTIQQLKKAQFTTILLSGDQTVTTQTVATELGIDEYYANQSPQQKNTFIKAHPTALMIGDGANDSEALMNATASVAVQGSLEISLIAADTYFTVPGGNKLIALITLAKQTRNLVRLNFGISLTYNIIGIGLVIGGYISPLFAAILMPLSSLSVLLNTILQQQKLIL